MNRKKQGIDFLCKICISVGGDKTDYKKRNCELERGAMHRKKEKWICNTLIFRKPTFESYVTAYTIWKEQENF